MTAVPILAITFDDCCATVAQIAAPVFARHGVAGTFFVCGAYVEKEPGATCTCKQPCRSPVTMAELRSMQAAGWEIGSHTWSHVKVDEVGPEKAEAELAKNTAWLRRHGFAPTGLSYPWGRYSDAVMPVVIRSCGYARATCGTHPSKFPVRYHYPAVVLSSKTSLADAVQRLNTNAAAGAATVFFGHRVGPGRDGYTWSPNDLEQLILAGLAAGVRIAPMRELFT